MDQVWLCYVYDANDDSGRESVVAVAATEELANEWLQKSRVEFRGQFFWNPDYCVPAIRAIPLGTSRVDNMYPFNQPHVKETKMSYDITKPQVPTDPLSMIYNVTVTDRAGLFPVGLLTEHGVWALVDEEGEFYYGDASEIESFDSRKNPTL